MRYEIPEYVREIFENASKFSHDLKKVLQEKAPLEKLLDLARTAEQEHKILTNEMIQFSEGIARSQSWLQKFSEIEEIEAAQASKTLQLLLCKKPLNVVCKKTEMNIFNNSI